MSCGRDTHDRRRSSQEGEPEPMLEQGEDGDRDGGVWRTVASFYLQKVTWRTSRGTWQRVNQRRCCSEASG